MSYSRQISHLRLPERYSSTSCCLNSSVYLRGLDQKADARKTNVHGTKGRRRIGSLERHVIIGYRDTNFGYYIRKAKRKLGSEMPPRIESEERIWQENLRCPQ